MWKIKAPCKGVFCQTWKKCAELKDNKKVALFLLAFFFYIDGVYTIIEMAILTEKTLGSVTLIC